MDVSYELHSAERCALRRGPLGMGVVAVVPIAPGEVAIELSKVFVAVADRHSIQLSPDRHQAFTDELDDFVNHACEPTARLEPEGFRIVAHREIDVGEEITLNYDAQEWDLAEPFVCVCDGVARPIRGFRHLSAEEQARLRPLAPAWLWERRRR